MRAANGGSRLACVWFSALLLRGSAARRVARRIALYGNFRITLLPSTDTRGETVPFRVSKRSSSVDASTYPLGHSIGTSVQRGPARSGGHPRGEVIAELTDQGATETRPSAKRQS